MEIHPHSYAHNLMSIWYLTVNQSFAALVAISFNCALLVRVIEQRMHWQNNVDWHRSNKLTTQVLVLRALFIASELPYAFRGSMDYLGSFRDSYMFKCDQCDRSFPLLHHAHHHAVRLLFGSLRGSTGQTLVTLLKTNERQWWHRCNSDRPIARTYSSVLASPCFLFPRLREGSYKIK